MSLYQFRGKIEKGKERTFKLNVILYVSLKNNKNFQQKWYGTPVFSTEELWWVALR